MLNMTISKDREKNNGEPSLDGVVYFGGLGFGWTLSREQLDEYTKNVRQMVIERMQRLSGGGF
jgi:phosphosulfolactate synthase (CoM biosynthesis protein A)